MSSLRKLRSRSIIHSKVNINSEAKPKRSELKLKGDKSANAVLTTEKFMPQTKLIPSSIMSTAENLVFEEACELPVVM
jgi:hypothetical protein